MKTFSALFRFSSLFLILSFALSISLLAKSKNHAIEKRIIYVTNPINQDRSSAFLLVKMEDLENLFGKLNPNGFTVYLKGEEIPSQMILDGNDLGLGISISFIKGSEKLKLIINHDKNRKEMPVYEKRTQAEISHKTGGYFDNRKYIGGEFQNVKDLHVPKEHTDHSWFIRYEGPGWESDKVAYRFYLDWRNGVDVFGKTSKDLVLQKVGQDGFDSYHELQDWGMDVLKVAKSLGVGSIATFENNVARRVDVTDSLYTSITNNGAIFSSILTKYYGWDIISGKTDLTSNLSIHAGTRLSKQSLFSSEPILNIATGLIKDPKGELIISGEKEKYGYIATFGQQSLNNDHLGIVVFFKNEDKVEITSDANSHIVILTPKNQSLTYYFAATWELDQDGIRTKEAFIAYLDQMVNELSHPLTISFKK